LQWVWQIYVVMVSVHYAADSNQRSMTIDTVININDQRLSAMKSAHDKTHRRLYTSNKRPFTLLKFTYLLTLPPPVTLHTHTPLYTSSVLYTPTQ